MQQNTKKLQDDFNQAGRQLAGANTAETDAWHAVSGGQARNRERQTRCCARPTRADNVGRRMMYLRHLGKKKKKKKKKKPLPSFYKTKKKTKKNK
eukprot:NODE_6390_length_510_cov_255.156044.p1 GENE.NODE_6390_length_510_cov_255.156044~~NODE_6390_length_510_cov_255.156044.p1  ORF type:complete len:95 (-),score=49.43 NODE_6390_length_510_cov_255.156044:3-287(-)